LFPLVVVVFGFWVLYGILWLCVRSPRGELSGLPIGHLVVSVSSCFSCLRSVCFGLAGWFVLISGYGFLAGLFLCVLWLFACSCFSVFVLVGLVACLWLLLWVSLFVLCWFWQGLCCDWLGFVLLVCFGLSLMDSLLSLIQVASMWFVFVVVCSFSYLVCSRVFHWG
jgi:hypothetical protein